MAEVEPGFRGNRIISHYLLNIFLKYFVCLFVCFRKRESGGVNGTGGGRGRVRESHADSMPSMWLDVGLDLTMLKS